jgi:hypothetical protein
MLLRLALCSLVGLACCLTTNPLSAQYPTRRQPTSGPNRYRENGPLARRSTMPRSNEMPARHAATVINEVIRPIPLTESRLEAAKVSVDREIRDQVEDFRADVRHFFPDKLEALSGTASWTAEDRAALSKALKSGDSEAIYAAWLEAEPDNTAGAERVAREAEVQRAFNRLAQEAEEGAVSLDHIDDLRAALDKLSDVVPDAADLIQDFDQLATWVQIQSILDEAEPDRGAARHLPTGRTKIIHNPHLAFGRAVVLNDETVMVGSRGRHGVEITRGNAAAALGLPTSSEDPVPDAEGAPMTSGTMLISPKRNGSTVKYVLDGQEYTMRPGSSQRLPANRRWVIEFDRGGREGQSQYTLSKGTYYFEPTDHGWELYRERFDVTIDNSRNPKDFHFMFAGEPQVVKAGRTRDVSSRYPIMIEYDRGNGIEMVRKALNFAGNVEVAINAEDNLWDLFPEEENRKQEREAALFN